MVAFGTDAYRCNRCGCVVHLHQDEEIASHICPGEKLGWWWIRGYGDRVLKETPIEPVAKKKPKRPRDGRYGPQWGFR